MIWHLAFQSIFWGLILAAMDCELALSEGEVLLWIPGC